MKRIKRWLCNWLDIETAGIVLKAHNDAINVNSTAIGTVDAKVEELRRNIKRIEKMIKETK